MTRVRHAAMAFCLLFALAIPAALPAAALAELSSGHIIENANKQSEEEAAKQAPANATLEKEKERESSKSLPSGLVLLGLGAAIVLLGGIAFVVVRDARSHAPVAEGVVPGGAGGGTRRNAEVHLRRRRAKAKAAKQQRKRNR